MLRSRALGRTAAGLAAAVFLSCTSTTSPDPDPTPGDATISVVVSPTSASVEQGGSTTFVATATLGGSFSGAVSIAVTGLPAGVTVTVGSVSVTGTTATGTVTIDAAASVAPGSYSGTVTASGSGASATAAYTLEVTAPAAGSYTLAATPGTVSINQGATGDVTVTLARTTFTEAVTLSAESLPAGVTAVFDPAAPTGSTSTLTLTVGGGASAGTTTVTIRGSSSLTDVTTTFDLTVTAPMAADFTLDFSTCPVEERPVWVAWSDGRGAPWTVSPNVSNTYAVTGLTQAILGVTFVTVDASASDVSVQYVDATGLSGLVDACGDGSKTVNGTVAGSASLAQISLGDALTSVFGNMAFSLFEVDDGSLPLVGYLTNDLATGEGTMLIRRDQNIADNGSLGTIDFGADGFVPASATITAANVMGETLAATMSYAIPYAPQMCSLADLYNVAPGATFTAYSAPPSEQGAGELHVAQLFAGGSTSTRQVAEAFSGLADRTLTLPAHMPTPSLTDVTSGGGYLRLQAEFNLPAEFDFYATFVYEGATQSIAVSADAGQLSGAATLTMPDFSGLAGWDDDWAPDPGATGVQYGLSGSSRFEDLLGTNPFYCTDGSRVVQATQTGVFN